MRTLLLPMVVALLAVSSAHAAAPLAQTMHAQTAAAARHGNHLALKKIHDSPFVYCQFHCKA